MVTGGTNMENDHYLKKVETLKEKTSIGSVTFRANVYQSADDFPQCQINNIGMEWFAVEMIKP
jgi:hypothetical protein